MASFSINSFAGSNPRLERHLLPRGAAARAVDCRLDSGALASWFEPSVETELEETGDVSTVLLRNPDCSLWGFGLVPPEVAQNPTCIGSEYVAEWNVSEVFRLTTGRSALPIAFKWDASAGSWVYYGPLKAPPAYEAPVYASGTPNVLTKDGEYRQYAYQVMNRLGQWSALSPAVEVPASDGDSVNVTLPMSVQNYVHGIYGVRWYRTVATVGSALPTVANTLQNVMDTHWIRGYESVPYNGLPQWVDPSSGWRGTLNEEMYEGLEEDVVIDPPDDLQGLTAIDSMQCFAGFVGKRLYFSENNNPGNWPHYLTLDDNICGIVESNGALYVATDGRPYVVSAVADCEGAGCRQVIKLPTALPMAGCGPRAMVALPQGAAYVSHKGLVGIAGTSAPTLITYGLYSAEQWQKLIPKSIRLALHSGKLFCFGQGGSFVLAIGGGPESEWALDSHTELSDRPIDAYTTRQGELILRTPTQMLKWNGGTKRRPHRWESQEFVAAAEVNFGAGHVRVRGGPEQLTVTFDDRKALDRAVLTSRQFRLPNWAVGTRWAFVLEGTGEVNLVSLAASMRELSA